MTGRRKAGRSWGPIRAETSEAAELAAFLRAQVDASGKTLEALQGEIHMAKSTISEWLAGKVPAQEFVIALIRATIPEPQLRDRRLAQAAQLLRAAASPSPPKPQPRPAAWALELAEVKAQQVETLERLTRSLEQQIQLREAAGTSAKLVMVLLAMLYKLERRISDLTDERDQLRAGHADSAALRQTQQQLTRAQELEQRAQQELRRAEEKQRQAEELAARVQAQVDHLTGELDRLGGSPIGATTDTTDNAGTTELAKPVVSSDPIGDDIDQALDRAAAVNDQDDETLQRITVDLAHEPGSEAVVPARDRKLSPTETKIVELIARGESNRAISRTLNLAPGTVETHALRIYEAYGLLSLGEGGDMNLRVLLALAYLRDRNQRHR
ncbi:LuxR C-terminal-related transcriptional regulator [Streptomyces avermitilis]|uniref:LuxR C-terminal-related transcriptional regulator n=1 Tax=Streptomyces avermitilis TaxID=33903 RepID=UPI0033A4BD7F